MKKVHYATLLVTAMAATPAAADSVFFKQTDQAGGNTVGIYTLVIEQKSGQGDRIGSSADRSLIEGRWNAVNIKQANGNNPNAIDLKVYGADASTSASINLHQDGEGNTHSLTVGANGDLTPFVNPVISAEVRGDNNTITDTLAKGLTGSTFRYAGTVNGDGNTITTASSIGVEDVRIGYDVSGNDNRVTMDFGSTNGPKRVSATVAGNSNALTFNAKSSDNSEIIFSLGGSDGSNTSGSINQTGGLSNMNMALVKNGIGLFTVIANNTAYDASASISVTALGAGSYTLNQTLNEVRYDATHTISDGGSVTVIQ